jgi:hypothetical protein
VTSCLSDPGSYHMTIKRSGLAALIALKLARAPRVAAGSGAEHPESATQPLSFELVQIEIVRTSNARVRCVAATVQQPE